MFFWAGASPIALLVLIARGESAGVREGKYTTGQKMKATSITDIYIYNPRKQKYV
jgi:hypothetical protein